MEEFKIAVNNFRDKSLRHLWGTERELCHMGQWHNLKLNISKTNECVMTTMQYKLKYKDISRTHTHSLTRTHTLTHTHTHFEDPNKGHFPGGQKEWVTSVQCLIKCEILLQSLLCSWVLTLNKGQQNVFVESHDVTEKLTFDLLNIKYYHVIIFILELFCQVFEFLNYGQNLGRSQQLLTF